MRVGVIDESTPTYADDRVVYALALAVVDEADLELVRERLAATLDRRRPLHWESEGTVTRAKVDAVLCELPVTVHVASLIVHQAGQQHARYRLLRERLLPLAVHEQVQRFLIERRSTSEDNRDRLELRNWYRASSARFARIEHVAKTEPLAWISDAMAGMWSDVVLGRSDGHFESLVVSATLRSAWQDWE